jgi:hypothetical protein
MMHGQKTIKLVPLLSLLGTLFQRAQTRTGAQQVQYPMRTESPFQGLQQLKQESHHLLSLSPKFKN